MDFKVKKIHKNAVIPEKVHENDAGFDMICVSKKETQEYIQYGTGISIEIPKGYVGFIVPRSSITKKDLMLKNSVGVIDSGYLGEISFRFYKIITEEVDRTSEVYDTSQGRLIKNSFNVLNHKKEEDQKVYEVGEKIGQIIFIKLPLVRLVETTDDLSETERGTGGYGSTDKKKKN
jgi:dUTP pyrophosphatase